jgi:hypothetical protein
VVEALTSRVLSRRRGERGDAPIGEVIKTLLHAQLAGAKNLHQAILDLSAELQIARLFLGAYQDAWMEAT